MLESIECLFYIHVYLGDIMVLETQLEPVELTRLLGPVDEMFLGLSSESSVSDGFTRGLPYDTEFRQVRCMYVTIDSFFLGQTWRRDRIIF